MTSIREFITKFIEDGKDSQDFRALLLMPTRGYTHDLMAMMLTHPPEFDPLIINVTGKEFTLPSGAKMFVREAFEAYDKFRLRGLSVNRIATTPGCNSEVVETACEASPGIGIFHLDAPYLLKQ